MGAYKQYIVQNTEKIPPVSAALKFAEISHFNEGSDMTTAPNGKTNIRWLSYQPPIASEPYPMITVSTGNCPRNYPTIWPYTDCPV